MIMAAVTKKDQSLEDALKYMQSTVANASGEMMISLSDGLGLDSLMILSPNECPII